ADDGLLGPTQIEPAVAALAASNVPGWQPEQGLCAECARRLGLALAELGTQRSAGSTAWPPILPTPLRLGAFDRFRGRGITIAFLDSGFFAHPDLVEPRDRVVKYVDMTRKGARRADLDRPDESSWHGMMT